MGPYRSCKTEMALVACLLMLSLQAFTQESVLDRPVRLPGASIKASRALGDITRLTGYLFTYDSQIINSNRTFSLPGEEMPVRAILDSVAGDPTVNYLVQGRHIILYRLTAMPEKPSPPADSLPVFVSVG
ncbi:MAG: hypothetical protein MUC70_05865, partial [Bacteroidales bacterium]|nr:hypothetical protein [Bacteroidales bacterium]